VNNHERRLMRKMALKKGSEAVYITACYDWKGREDAK
jgi:hypothetical protein